MALITWSDRYSVQVKEFDEHHKKLVGYVNELNDAMKVGKGKDKVPVILGKLVNYTKVHFSREEELMKKHGYPEFLSHKGIHDKLMAEVGDFQREFEKGNLSVPIKLMSFLQSWLMDHIQNTDKKYGYFFKTKGIE